MFVNVASNWGLTKQNYKELVEIYGDYSESLEIFGFPCNQFMGQEPKNEAAIKQFVGKYGVTFPMFSKIEVNGKNTFTWQ